MNRKKITLIIVVVVIVLITVGIIYVVRGGFTGKQRYENCMETCYDLLLLDSSKVYCSEQCTKDTGYDPSATEEKEIEDGLKNANTIKNTNTVTTNTSTNINKTVNTNSSSNSNSGVKANVNIIVYDYENIEYYCEWSWPQKIIDMDTKEVIKECTSQRPWCNKADGTYEKAGCCKDTDYTDCITVPDLIE